jgi:hypothetical protein
MNTLNSRHEHFKFPSCTLQIPVMNTSNYRHEHFKFPSCTLQILAMNTSNSRHEHFKFPPWTLQIPVMNTSNSRHEHFKFPPWTLQIPVMNTSNSAILNLLSRFLRFEISYSLHHQGQAGFLLDLFTAEDSSDKILRNIRTTHYATRRTAEDLNPSQKMFECTRSNNHKTIFFKWGSFCICPPEDKHIVVRNM